MSLLVFITTEDCARPSDARIGGHHDNDSTLVVAATGYKIKTPVVSDPGLTMIKAFHALSGGIDADSASHMFILVDRSGKVRVDRDYPSMWIGSSSLLELLPKAA